jgi:hypothetical protein
VTATLAPLWSALLATVRDVLPIVLVIVVFQFLVLKRQIPNLPRVAAGFAFVVVGLTLFLLGLELALFPLGEAMARQLASPEFLGVVGRAPVWSDYIWTYVFAFTIALSTAIAEPSLIAVATKAEEVSAGAVSALGLRLAVALGAGFGAMLGTVRIVTGASLPVFILVGYALVVLLTIRSSKDIVPLAYDSGGVTTSTVTVPLVAALGLGLADNVPGRSPLADGFGLIAFTAVFPIVSVLAYAQLARLWQRRRRAPKNSASDGEP